VAVELIGPTTSAITCAKDYTSESASAIDLEANRAFPVASQWSKQPMASSDQAVVCRAQRAMIIAAAQ